MSTTVSGIIPVHKPAGMSSFDVIRVVRRRLQIKKMGHAGTLDVPAEGVLLIAINEATKAFDALTGSLKGYRAVIRFGAATFTDDAEGEIIKRFDKTATLEAIQAALPHFTGHILQKSPKVSALRVDGKRSYDLARSGEDVPQKERNVYVDKIDLIGFDDAAQTATLDITCGSGTYIRSIARDLGEMLETGAYVEHLTRTFSAGVSLEMCVPPDDITLENLDDVLIPLNIALAHYPALQLTVPQSYATSGKPLTLDVLEDLPPANGLYRLVKDESLLALVEKSGTKIRYKRVFNGL